MNIPPNMPFFTTLIEGLEKEYDIPVRLSRYQSAAPELLEFATSEGLKEEEATRALFVTDFIATSSEVPAEASDNDRYKSIFQAFILGRSRNGSADKLMKVFFVAYKTAIKMRSQDLFMGGRGIPRKVSLLRLKDYFVTPYLEAVGKYLSAGSCGWELGILAAALKRTYPEFEIKNFQKLPDYKKIPELTTPIWTLLNEHELLHTVTLNSSVTISNMNETEAVLIFNKSQPTMVALWNTVLKSKINKEKLIKLNNLLINQLYDTDIALIKGRITNTLEYFFIIRDPLSPAKPLLFMKTPADDVNATAVSQILHLRGLEEYKTGSWKDTLSDKKTMSKPEKPVTQVKKPDMETKPVKTGFFSRIKSKIFKSETQSEVSMKPVEKEKPGKSVFKRGSFATDASFIPQSLVIEAVSNLEIVETFDTFREGNFAMEGIFETDVSTNKTTFLSKPSLNLSSSTITFLDTAKPLITSIFQEFFFTEEILIDEVFLTNKERQKYLIIMDGNQEMTVGLLARAPPDGEIENWKARGLDLDDLQRKSLIMRTKQYLSARRHTSFDEAADRIYGQNFAVSNAHKDVHP
ncbi:MAG: hypothetical protein ACW98W_04000 [Candidatus Hodarchaeales archaeon]|jgi:hypothetical protein